MTMSIEQLDTVLRVARKKKTDNELKLLKEEVERERKQLELLRSKERSLQIQIEADHNQATKAATAQQDLESLKDQLDEGSYKEASEAAIFLLNEAEKKVQDDIRTLSTLQQEISCKQASVSQLIDKEKSMSNSDYVPKFHENVSDEALIGKCRPEIVIIAQEVNLLSSLLATLVPDLKEIHLTCSLAAGRIRQAKLKFAALNPSEEVILRRCLGKIGSQTKIYMSGMIDALKHTVERDWTQYVEQAKSDLNAYRARRLIASRPKVLRIEKEDPVEDKAATEMESKAIELGVPDKTDKLKMAIFGGIPTRNDWIEDWLADFFKFSKVSWYENSSEKDESARIITSIKNGGLDMVLIMTQWVAHAQCYPVVEAAKKRGLRIVMCNSSSKNQLCFQISYVLGFDLRKQLQAV